MTEGKPGTRVLYFTSNANGEAEVIKITLELTAKKRQNIIFERDFSTILIKRKEAKGNLLTHDKINRISLKSHGRSTLGGRKVWFDKDINRINYEERGDFLGEFNDTDRVLIILNTGEYLSLIHISEPTRLL